MNVISRRVLLEKAAKYPDAKTALQVWLDTAVEANWQLYIKEFLTHAEYDKDRWKKWL